MRAELVPVVRLSASHAYGTDFGGLSTVLVGDTPFDVEAALVAGARAVGVATGGYSAAELAAAGAHAAAVTGIGDHFRRCHRPGHRRLS